MVLSRRGFLAGTVTAAAAGLTGAALAPTAAASLGTVLDYAGGVPSAAAIKAAGHKGVIRYVSARRPGAEWMAGKPFGRAEADALKAQGLEIASVYQYGKDPGDWARGGLGGAADAATAIGFHVAAGGPGGAVIYAAIDSNPTRDQYTSQIRPYLQAFRTALQAAGYRLGIYGNYNVIVWAESDGLGPYYWQHNWGSEGKLHSAARLHQYRIDKDTVGGVTVDLNSILHADWGQWSTTGTTAVIPSVPTVSNPIQVPSGGFTLPGVGTVTDTQINNAVTAINSLARNGSSL